MDYSTENEKLWILADSIDSTIGKKLRNEIEILEFIDETCNLMNERIVLTGSCAEGTKVNTPKDEGDADALIVSGNVALDESLFEYIQEYPAFLKVKMDKEHTDIFTESDVSGDGFILAETLRSMNERHFIVSRLLMHAAQMPEKTAKRFTYSHSSSVGLEKLTISDELIPSGSLDEKDLDKFDRFEAFRFLSEKLGHHLQSSSDQDYCILGDLLKTNMECFKKYTTDIAETAQVSHEVIDKAVLIKSTDYVPAYALKSETWPRVAQDWIYRARYWPQKNVVDNIISAGCQVFSKPLPHLMSDGQCISEEPDVYFRLSFSESEVLLAKSMNVVQNTCWRVLKAFQKGFLETSPKVLTSYHWKNVIFWMCESEEGFFWEKENLLFAVKKSLDKMYTYLSEGNIPQYFCRNMNLIRHCDTAMINKLKEKLEQINEDPLGHLENFLQNPPEPRLCSLDISSLPSGSRNKLIQTGHSSVCGMFNVMFKDGNGERIARMMKDGSRLLVKLASKAYEDSNRAASTESKKRRREIEGAANKFFEDVITPLPGLKKGGEFKSLFKKESVKLAKRVGKAYLSTMTEDTDIDLD